MSSEPTAGELAFIREQRVGRLATADSQGNPHVVPICYAFDGEHFYTPLDEKPKRVEDLKLQRVRNILANEHVSLVIDRYEEDWSKLAWVRIDGRAKLIQPSEESHARALELLRRRYEQYRRMTLEERPIIAVRPSRITSWGAV